MCWGYQFFLSFSQMMTSLLFHLNKHQTANSAKGFSLFCSEICTVAPLQWFSHQGRTDCRIIRITGVCLQIIWLLSRIHSRGRPRLAYDDCVWCITLSSSQSMIMIMVLITPPHMLEVNGNIHPPARYHVSMSMTRSSPLQPSLITQHLLLR